MALFLTRTDQRLRSWQIDANQVRDFYMINNTDSIYSFKIPVEYPKVGEDLSPARIGVISLIDEQTTWMKIPGEANKFYEDDMGSARNSLMIQQLNRKQNHSKIYIGDANSGEVELLTEEGRSKGGPEKFLAVPGSSRLEVHQQGKSSYIQPKRWVVSYLQV